MKKKAIPAVPSFNLKSPLNCDESKFLHHLRKIKKISLTDKIPDNGCPLIDSVN